MQTDRIFVNYAWLSPGGARSRPHESGPVLPLTRIFLAARKFWSLQGIYKEIKFTRKWHGKIQKLKEIARISVTKTNLYQLQVLN
jgi:hypothetical protein